VAVVADDNELCRFGISEILKRDLGFADVKRAASLHEALEFIGKTRAVELALFELTLPGMNRGSSLQFIREAFPSLRIAVIAATGTREDVLAVLSVGVHGFVPKDMAIADIVHAMKLITNGEVFVPASMAEVPVTVAPSVAPNAPTFQMSPNIGDLTQRQQDVLSLLVRGMSNKEIAKALDLSPGTVKVHINGVFRALGVRNRAGAIALASSAYGRRPIPFV
jgi:DNA-binding NarL/FixJ family response regulator